jgi:predicted RNase H-like HicB family nuclease
VRNGHSKKQGYLLPLRIEQSEDGRFLGRRPKLPGLNVQGNSIAEVVRLAPRVARSLLAAMRAKGVSPPRGLPAARSPLRIQVLIRA